MSLDMPWVDYDSVGGKKSPSETSISAAQASSMWAEWERSRGGKRFIGDNVNISDIFDTKY